PKPIVDFDGAYVYIQWENRKIMVSKIDVVSHSMGGVVTRQYITRGDYKDNIRKLVMIAPPHHGAYFLNWVPLLQGPIGGDALAQLRPMSSFQDAINGNNRKILDTDVKPYIIAGNGWATRIRHQSGQIYQKTWRGDGVVAIDSAKLSGIPMYCTWDNHAPEVDWMKIECDIVAENKGGGIMDSPLTFAITKDLLLTGNTAQRTASCEEDFCKPPLPSVTDNYVPPTASNPMRTSYGSASAYIESPVTIHAFDQDGKHIGLNEQGEVENEIGDHAFYFSAQKTGTHPIIKVLNFPGQDIVFKTVGYEEGKYNMVVIIETYDAITEMRFEDVATDENTQHSIDTTLEELDLAEEEKTITVKIPEDYLVDSPESSPEVNDQDQNVEDVPETGDLSRTSDEQEGGFFSWLAKLFKGIFGGSTQSKPEDKSQSTGEKGTKYYLTPENTVSFVSDEYHFTGHKNTEGLLTGEWTPTETYGFLVKTDIPALKNEKNGKLHVKISNYHNKQNKDETCDITKGFTINKLTSDWDADTASFGKIESLQSNSVVIGRFNVDPNVQKPKEYFEIILPVKELVGEYGFTIIQTGDGLCRLEVYSHMSSENNRPYITVE
ncbi:MAG: hypothetical protein KKG59_01010, partial [Nanoarchaeota archaeon]|nr:hypothetical protein [Nanoarchaeota archaeon]